MDEKRGEQPLTVRFPREVLVAMRRLARAHGRSFNGEVVWALREYVERQPEPDAPEGRQSNDDDNG